MSLVESQPKCSNWKMGNFEKYDRKRPSSK